MPTVRIWFYNPQEDASGFVNKLVSRLDPPFCHCEVQFIDNHACSIYMGSNVVFKERTFISDNYTKVELECGSTPYQSMYAAAKKYADTGVEFSTIRMTASLAPAWVVSPAAPDKTFCSELCANVLCIGGLLPAALDTSKMTPSGLYHKLKEKQSLPPPGPVAPARSVAIDFK